MPWNRSATRGKILILAFAIILCGGGAAGIAMNPALHWRAALILRKLTGKMPELSWAELTPMMVRAATTISKTWPRR